MAACALCKKDLAPEQELACPDCAASYCPGHVASGPWWYLAQVSESQYRVNTCPRGHEWKEYSKD